MSSASAKYCSTVFFFTSTSGCWRISISHHFLWSQLCFSRCLHHAFPPVRPMYTTFAIPETSWSTSLAAGRAACCSSICLQQQGSARTSSSEVGCLGVLMHKPRGLVRSCGKMFLTAGRGTCRRSALISQFPDLFRSFLTWTTAVNSDWINMGG